MISTVMNWVCDFMVVHPVTTFGLLWFAVAVVDHFTTKHTKEVR